MYKQLLSATAIALALGLPGCASSISPPHEDRSFANPRPVAESAYDEKLAVADAAFTAGDKASAIHMYRELARDNPLSLEPRLKLGDALLAANAPQEAARAYEGANGIRATYDGVTGIGRVYLALRQPADALKAFDRAAKMRAGDDQAMNGQAVALDQLGRHDEAQRIYQAILQKEPSNIKVRSNYALSLAFAGKYDEAADILNSLAQVPDSDDRIRQNLALVYGLAGNSGQAAHFGRMDLDEDAVSSNLKYYGAMRSLDAPSEKYASMTRPTAHPTPNDTNPFDAAQLKPSSQPVAASQPSAEQVSTASASEISERTIHAPKTNNAHAASRPVLGLAGVKPVVVAHVEPAKSSSPAEVRLPTDQDLGEILAPAPEVKFAKPEPKSAAKIRHTSLESLPMTRAEAAARATSNSAGTDDLVPSVAKPTSKPSPTGAAQSVPAPTVPLIAGIAKPQVEPVAEQAKPQQPSHRRAPAVPGAAVGMTASITPNPAVPASDRAKSNVEPVSGPVRPIDANPVDTGARAPAVPALL